MLLKIIFYVSNSNQNIDSEKLQKKLLFSDLKSTHSQLSLEKINVVATLDRFVANFEIKLRADYSNTPNFFIKNARYKPTNETSLHPKQHGVN